MKRLLMEFHIANSERYKRTGKGNKLPTFQDFEEFVIGQWEREDD